MFAANERTLSVADMKEFITCVPSRTWTSRLVCLLHTPKHTSYDMLKLGLGRDLQISYLNFDFMRIENF